MKKITNRIVYITVFFMALTALAIAQCNASFTYTLSNSSIYVTSTSTGTLSNTTYSWVVNNASGVTVGGYNSYGASSPSFSVPYNDTYSLALKISDSLTCSNTSTQTVVVSNGVNAPACSSSFTYTVGSAGQVAFTNTSPIDSLRNTNYSWYFNNSYGYGSDSTTTSPTNTFYYNGTYTVTLNVVNVLDGCSASSSQTITITNASPMPSCNPNFTYTVGANGLVNFTGLYAGMAPSTHINWDFGDGTYNTTISPTCTYAYNGTYSVTLNIEDSLANCFGNSTQTISITNAATQPCVANVIFNMHQDSLNPQPGIWEVSTYYSPQITSAVWSWGDGTSTNGLSPIHTYTTAGQYNICVTAYASCGDSVYVCQSDSLYRTTGIISVKILNVNGVTGIKTNTADNDQILVYPNPGSGLFMLNLSHVTAATKAQINITNILGEVIYTIQEPVNNNTIAKEINLQSIANGAYFLKITLGDKTYTNKLIKN